MWNPFRSKNKTLKELKDLAAMTAIFEKWSRRGVIFWRKKDKILIIEEYLAMLKMSEGRDGFLKFLNQVAMWQNNNIAQEAYEAHRLKVETDAVRKAQRKYAALTKADIMRIRQEARENMPMIPLEQLDCIKEFDIFVVRANAPSAQEATEESGQLLALGHFDGEKVEIAMYEDIKYILYDRSES
nr:MAG TPA: hypothetical protein [Caudoviricetes sp.]